MSDITNENACPECNGRGYLTKSGRKYRCEFCSYYGNIYSGKDKRMNIEIKGTSADDVAKVLKVAQEYHNDKQNISVNANTGAVVNIGDGNTYGSISTDLSCQNINDGIDKILTAVRESPEVKPEVKQEVIPQLEYLKDQASLPEEKRTPNPVIKPLLIALAATLSSIKDVATIWNVWGDKIWNFFNHIK